VGAKCSFTPSGGQELEVVIPADTKDGEMILALEGKGKKAPYGGPSGTLYITISTRPDPSSEALISRQLHTLEQELGFLKTANSNDTENIILHLQNVLNDTNLLKTNNNLKIDRTGLARIISTISAIFLAIIIIVESCFFYFMTSSQHTMVITTL